LVGLASKSSPDPSAKFRVILSFIYYSVSSFVNAKEGCSSELPVGSWFQSNVVRIIEMKGVPPPFGTKEKVFFFFR
jgi:hypothetical protein